MDFRVSDKLKELELRCSEAASRFPQDYWRMKDEKREFPKEFFDWLGRNNFFATAANEEHGGLGEGLVGLTHIVNALAFSGIGVGSYLMLPNSVVAYMVEKFGTENQKDEILPSLIRGKLVPAMGLYERPAGSDVFSISTAASKIPGGYLVKGKKDLVNNAEISSMLIIVARTTPAELSERRSSGLTLFLAQPDKRCFRFRRVEKVGMNYIPTSDVEIDSYNANEADKLGETDQGWKVLAPGLNADRIAVSGMLSGAGQWVTMHAARYANERQVFGRSIGAYQGIQFRLSEAYTRLEAAKSLALRAAWAFDSNIDHIGYSSMAKFEAAEAAFNAVDAAMQTLGGLGYLADGHIERHWRDIRLWKILPLTQELALGQVAERVLGLPRSY